MADNREDNLEERLESPESDIEEEEDSPRSEHGDTTDGENEVIYYWERLKIGVMSHPAPLQLPSVSIVYHRTHHV